MGSFVFGVEQFFSAVSGSEPKVTFNSDIQQIVELIRDIFRQSIKMRELPKCFLYYATAGKWTEPRNGMGRLSDVEDRLRALNLFSAVHSEPVDSELLKSVYRELERGVVKEFEFSKTAVFPRIEGVDDAYIGLLAGDEFIRMVSTDDQKLNRELFYDNVRDFQGNNPVNSEINETLSDKQHRHNFPLLNNGVTIVAREMSRKGDLFTISDFQIVNGCQTTHILFQNRGNIGPNTFIPVKLLVTRDRHVITEVIKATNRQTAVLPEALESLTTFHKELEDFYTIRESARQPSDRIFYERRSKQYAGEKISPKKIVSLTLQLKSFIGMFLNEPHSHPHYYGELLRSYEGRVFANDHKPEAYYASGIAFLTVDAWLNSNPEEKDLRSYKYQILMLVRTLISGYNIPKLNSKAISEYSLKIVDVLRDPNRTEKVCRHSASLVRSTLGKFGNEYGGNPPHRLRGFTESLIKDHFQPEKPVRLSRPSRDNALPSLEKGQIVWFDEQKNYGFLSRDSGGDVFVHGSKISQIPWHLRISGTEVTFRVIPNPKSPSHLMASEVALKTT